jgi:hypothetical protein
MVPKSLITVWIAILALHTPSAMAQENPPDSPPPVSEGQETGPAPSTAPEANAPTPKKDEPSTDRGLTDLLEEDVPTSSVGSFGYRLRRYGVDPYIHGVLASKIIQLIDRPGDAPTQVGSQLFDAHLYVGADILDVVVPEIFIELEPLQFFGSSFQWLNVRYAQIDFRLMGNHLVMRSGIFLIPFGTYNTYSYPHFITKLPERPGFFREIVPSPWNEVGLQFLGEWEYAPGLSLRYAAYFTNGRAQPDFNIPGNPADDGIDEGGSLFGFTPSYLDDRNNEKSFGARISADIIKGLSVGLSGYTGAYTVNGARQLTMVGIDTTFQRDALTVEAEAAFVHQQITDGALKKWGYAIIASYRVHPMVEPLLAIDDIRLNGPRNNDTRTYSAGFSLYPFPDKVPTAVGRAVYGAWTRRGDGGTEHRATLEVAVGF